MKNFKKALRVAGLILFLVLAAVGVGFGAILPTFSRRDDSGRPAIELVEAPKDNAKAPGEEYQP